MSVFRLLKSIAVTKPQNIIIHVLGIEELRFQLNLFRFMLKSQQHVQVYDDQASRQARVWRFHVYQTPNSLESSDYRKNCSNSN